MLIKSSTMYFITYNYDTLAHYNSVILGTFIISYFAGDLNMKEEVEGECVKQKDAGVSDR